MLSAMIQQGGKMGGPPDGDSVCHCTKEPLVDETPLIDQPDDQCKAEAKATPCSVTPVLPDVCTKESWGHPPSTSPMVAR